MSDGFTESLKAPDGEGIEDVWQAIRDRYAVSAPREGAVSSSASLKLGRFILDIQESIECLNGIKIHGTPISLRAYLLLSLYILPFIFAPNLVYHLDDDPRWLTYLLNAINGFVLMSLYNLQEFLENPFDQMGLDDIKVNEFEFADPAPSPEALGQ